MDLQRYCIQFANLIIPSNAMEDLMNTGFSIVNILTILLCPTMAEQCFNISVEATLHLKEKTWA